MPSAALPDYDPLQSAFHQTFRDDLYRVVDALPVEPTARVLDAPCGDGFYARRLAARLAAGGRLTLVDHNPAYREKAERAVADAPAGVAVEVRDADVYALPFAAGSFDFVWCAQSLVSLDDHARLLRELHRVTRPGGWVGVLEADEFHHVLLPWPLELELAVQKAVLNSSRRRFGDGSHLAPSRHLRAALADAGWTPARKVTVASDLAVPFPPPAVDFLTRHLEFLGDLVRGDLSPTERAAFDRLADAGRPDSLVTRADAELTCLNTVHLARKPD